MENILDIASVAFQGDAIKRLSSVLHESQTATQRGIEAAMPASLAGIAAHASSAQKAEELLGAIRGGNYPHIDAHEVTTMVDDPAATARLSQSGQGFLSRIFGSKLSGIIDAIAGQVGVSRTSASTLMGLAAPLVLNQVGKETASRNLDARGLSQFLGEQGRRASSALPAPLTTALGALGGFTGEGATGKGKEAVGGVRDVGAKVGSGFDKAKERAESVLGDGARRARAQARSGHDEVARRLGATEHTRAAERRGLGWLIAGLVLLVVLAFALFRSRGPRHVATPPVLNPHAQGLPTVSDQLPEVNLPKVETPTPPKAASKAPPAEVTPPKEPIPKAGSPENTPKAGASELSAYLSGSGTAAKRFALRGTEFSSGSPAITNTAELDQVATALTQHPTAKVRIEGNADAVGSAATNQKLSQERADAVKSYLVARGVASNRLESVGRAFEQPRVQTTDANSENRRVDLVVTER